jgi:hypothetical protein
MIGPVQSVNFYQIQFRPVRDFFSFYSLLVLTGLVALLLAMTSAGMLYYSGGREAHVASLKEKEAALKRELGVLEKKFPIPRGNDALKKELEELHAETARMTRSMQLLEKARSSNELGFSPFLEALAQNRVPGVWLERFGLFSGGEYVMLEGKVNAQDRVAHFIDGLGRQPPFAKRTFRTFKLAKSVTPAEDVSPRGETFDFTIKTMEGLAITVGTASGQQRAAGSAGVAGSDRKKLEDATKVSDSVRNLTGPVQGRKQ